ncbi:MAG: shikimate kinase [Candidatus Omnitrophica bacterium]|nr:shikimate kinase [Candidatus Omnitrophota bacterium]
MKNIVLTGFMGTGKTEVSKIIEARLKIPRLCLDDMIEKSAGRKISDIFKVYGEPHFRKIESDMVALASDKTGVVIDAGGGAIINEDNLKNLKRTGIIFCLSASADAIFERIRRNASRPLLNTKDPKNIIAELLVKRAPFYKKADYTIDTTALTPDKAADEIIGIMKKHE